MFRLDHVVIVVATLADAVADFERLGFTVTPGGKHEAFGSQNALIAFEDDSYLELIAFSGGPVEGPTPAERRVRQWSQAAEGLVDFALLPEAIEADVAAARGRGLALSDPQAGSRLRPDGQEVAWQFAFPDALDLPFLCGDVTPRKLRVPPGAARQHRNGALGVAKVSVGALGMAHTLERYRALLGHPPTGHEFQLGPTTLSVIPATGAQGPRSLFLHTSEPEFRGRLDPALAHGAAMELL